MGAGRNVFSCGFFSSTGCGFFSSTGAGVAAGAGASDTFTLPFGTNFRTLVSLMMFVGQACLSYSKLFQRQPIFFSHRRMTVLVGSFNPALISLFGLVLFCCRLIGARQHAKRVSFIVRDREVTLQCFDHLRRLSNLLILLRQAKQNAAVDWIVHQHLLEDVDARGGHSRYLSRQQTANSRQPELRITISAIFSN